MVSSLIFDHGLGAISEAKRLYYKEYHQRPEVKERNRVRLQRPEVNVQRRRHAKEYKRRPGVKLRRRQYGKAYRQRPEAKELKRQRMEKYRQRPRFREQQRQYNREYSQRPEVKLRRAAYFKLQKVKEKRRRYLQRPETKLLYVIQRAKHRRRSEVKEQRRLYAKGYRQRPETKLRDIMRIARRRAKGFTPLCPNEWGCPVDWHHISPSHPHVVPLPRAVHRTVRGNSPFHFAFNASMICLLYGLDSHPFLGGCS